MHLTSPNAFVTFEPTVYSGPNMKERRLLPQAATLFWEIFSCPRQVRAGTAGLRRFYISG